jgi:hypothetical protein
MSSPRAGRQIANLRPPLGFQPTIPDSAANPLQTSFHDGHVPMLPVLGRRGRSLIVLDARDAGGFMTKPHAGQIRRVVHRSQAAHVPS